MKSCDEILELISAELDEQLSEQEQVWLDEHLSGCETCRILREQMRQVSAALRENTARAPEGFADKVMTRVAAGTGRLPASAADVESMALRAKRRSAWRKWTASAAVVAVVVLGAVALPGRGTDTGMTMKTESAMDASMFLYAADMDVGGMQEDSVAADRYAVTAGTASYSAAVSADTADALPAAVPETSAEIPEQKYCGVLTFSREDMPDGLEEYPCVSEWDGVLEYEVPAEYYLELAAARPAFGNGEDLNLYAECIDESAQKGLIRILMPVEKPQ